MNNSEETERERVCNCGLKESEHNVRHPFIPRLEPKQETLKEAAREYWKRGQFGLEKAADTEMAFLRGGLWQAERMYSEEEVLELLHKRMIYTLGEEYKKETTLKWFEKIKKK